MDKYLRANIVKDGASARVTFSTMRRGELIALKAALDALLVKKVVNPTLSEVAGVEVDDIKSIIMALSDAGIEERLRRGWGY